MAEAVKLPTLLSNEVVRSNSVMNTLVEDKDDDYKSHVHVLFCRWLMILMHIIYVPDTYEEIQIYILVTRPCVTQPRPKT